MAEGNVRSNIVMHPREAERLIALRSPDILDPDPETPFDQIAQLVARLCEVPVAFVNLIDDHHRFAGVAAGADPSGLPVFRSLCTPAMMLEGDLEIPDMQADPRTRDNPLCHGDTPLRFYAGASISSPDGIPLGTLCILDRRPRILTDLQRTTLKVMAGQVTTQLDLRRSLAAAETLRLEVDHRVKNSLQSLSAFVNLKARGIESPDARDVLDSVTRNIRTVSLLHEMLYKTDAGAVVDLGRYVATVVELLHSIAPVGIAVTTDAVAGMATVSSHQASEVGTLVNEVVSNAFKHAFPDGRTGTVRIALSMPEPGRVHLSCTDDGAGLPPGARPAGGLGMKLISAIAAHLRGTVTHGSAGQGMRVDLTFPVDPAPGAAPLI